MLRCAVSSAFDVFRCSSVTASAAVSQSVVCTAAREATCAVSTLFLLAASCASFSPLLMVSKRWTDSISASIVLIWGVEEVEDMSLERILPPILRLDG